MDKKILLILLAFLAFSEAVIKKTTKFSRAMSSRNRAFKEFSANNPHLSRTEAVQQFATSRQEADICNPIKPDCDPNSRFRTIDGSCNFLEKPLVGAANTPFDRFCDAEYADGEGELFGSTAAIFRAPEDRKFRKGGNGIILLGPNFTVSAPDVTKDDEEGEVLFLSRQAGVSSCRQGNRINLPEPRVVSTHFSPDVDAPSKDITLLVMQFGQFLDHDLTFTPEEEEPEGGCCEHVDDPECIPISVPTDDIFVKLHDHTCIDLTRSVQFCAGKTPVREQFNTVTSFVDGSNVYGSDEKRRDSLRNDFNGLMLTSRTEAGIDLLPRLDERTVGLTGTLGGKAGDLRALENPGLSTIHTLFVREHNRVAREITRIRPDFNRDEVFENARRIVSAEIQAITYGQWLQVVLGDSVIRETRLRNGREMTKYDPSNLPIMTNEFATAAFRFGHTLIQGMVDERDPATNEIIGSHCIRDNFNDPRNVTRDQGRPNDQIIAGLMGQPAQSYDRFLTEDVTNFLRSGFASPDGTPAAVSDLMARNIKRGRDHGIPGYNHYRDICGLPQACSWNTPPAEISPENWRLLSELYNHPDDIDLFVAGIAEGPAFDGLVGATFNCLIRSQFFALKFGDRYYLSHENEAGSFSGRQYRRLRRRTLGDLICDNTDVKTVTENVFVRGSAPIRCGEHHQLDLSIYVRISNP